VANARVYDGVHFRFSTEAGLAMGRQIGALAAARLLAAPAPVSASGCVTRREDLAASLCP